MAKKTKDHGGAPGPAPGIPGVAIGWMDDVADHDYAAAEAYLSIKLDNPFLAAPVNCALVKQSEGYALIWERKKPKAESADAE